MPTNPNFSDAFIAVSDQTHIAFTDFSLRTFGREPGFQLVHVNLVSENFESYDAPFHVCAQSADLAHLNDFAFEHGDLSERKSLVRLTAAAAQRFIDDRLVLDDVHRVRKQSLNNRRARWLVLSQSGAKPMTRNPGRGHGGLISAPGAEPCKLHAVIRSDKR